MNNKKKDIMENILGGYGDDLIDRVKELDCLIYKNGSNLESVKSEGQDKKIWQASKENVSVQVWEDKAKIKVRVSPGKKESISMKRIAKIAVTAILEELKKED